MREAIYNSTVAYVQVYGAGAGSNDRIGIGKPELLQKLEEWHNGIAIIKPKEKMVIPGFLEKDLAAKIVTESHQGVVWLPRNAMFILQDSNVFAGMFGKVRKETIQGVGSIPEWIEFARKTMKMNKNLDNQKERPVKALACLVNHPGVIKLLYLNIRSYESYSMWWNGGLLMNMLVYNKTIVDTHESEILRSLGFDFEARQKLVVYGKNPTYLV